MPIMVLFELQLKPSYVDAVLDILRQAVKTPHAYLGNAVALNEQLRALRKDSRFFSLE